MSLLLHLLVAGAGPLADAWLEASSRGVYDHVESRRDHACTPAHDHLSCGICRTLDLRSPLPWCSPEVRRVAVRSDRSRPLPSSPVPSAAPVSSLGPRAPPSA